MNLEWCPHMAPTCCGNNLRRFCKSYDIHCLETRPFSSKRHIFEKEWVRHEVDATIALFVGLGKKSTIKIHHYLVHVKT